jgi:hypothetical protein
VDDIHYIATGAADLPGDTRQGTELVIDLDPQADQRVIAHQYGRQNAGITVAVGICCKFAKNNTLQLNFLQI